jgi:hypothetical protein
MVTPALSLTCIHSTKFQLEKTERAIKNGQSRDTGNIGGRTKTNITPSLACMYKYN